LHACRLQAGFRRPILRNHRRRLRSLDRVQLGLLGCWPWLGVRQQQRVRGRLNLPAADLCGVERGQLLRVNREWLRRDARVQHNLSKTGWVCTNGLCKAGPTSGCVAATCTTANGDQYSRNHRRRLRQLARLWEHLQQVRMTCQNHLCKGDVGVCTPLACTTANGDQYCGTVGDGCGHSLDCGSTCSKTGWTCRTTCARQDRALAARR